MTVGWVFSVGKGGARRAGDTDENIYPAGVGVHKPASERFSGTAKLQRCLKQNIPDTAQVNKDH